MRARLCLLVLVVAVVTAGCGLPYITPPGAAPLRYRDDIFTGVTITNDVTYGSALDQAGTPVTLKLDMYRPTGDTSTHRPAIVWVHGGGFSGGNKSSPELIDEATYFGKKGYVSVSIDYRLAPGGCSAAGATPACIQGITDAKHDAQAAVRFLRANASTYGIDTSRIAIGGSSAGAITALNVAASADDPGTSGNPGFSSAVGGAVSLSGASLLVTIDPTDAPMLDFHGTADPLVPYAWAQSTLAQGQAAGIITYLTTWEGAGHVPYAQHRQEILDQTQNFLYWTLKLANAS
jgi:para-nitrobenzyl esterase